MLGQHSAVSAFSDGFTLCHHTAEEQASIRETRARESDLVTNLLSPSLTHSWGRDMHSPLMAQSPLKWLTS